MAKSDRDVVILLAVVLIGTALVTFLLGGFVVPSVKSEPRATVEDVPIEKDEEHILALDHEALDKAYKDHIGLVFSIWMKDPNDPDAARRAGNGARNARRGYAISRSKIEDRERKLKESKSR
jgi:hypothetical protein